jgi:hypothetical protein
MLNLRIVAEGYRRFSSTRVWQKWRFSAPQTLLWLIKDRFSASTFVVKIATFAKPENVDTKLLAIFTIKSCLKLKIKNHRFFASNFANGICERQFFQANRLKSSIKLHKIMQKVNRINE